MITAVYSLNSEELVPDLLRHDVHPTDLLILILTPLFSIQSLREQQLKAQDANVYFLPKHEPVLYPGQYRPYAIVSQVSEFRYLCLTLFLLKP